MENAVVYARYSSERQNEQSIEGQIRVCEDYAKNNDITIVDYYIDRAKTGTNDKRPAFQQLIKDSNIKQWNYVLVYRLDRFSRNRYESIIYKHVLQKNGVKLLSVTENIPVSPEGILLESLIEGLNQYYSEELSQKIKRGKFESLIKGNFSGGVIPYGYRIKDKKIIIEEDEAKVIKYCFLHYVGGELVTDIIKHLTDNKILFHEKPFKPNDIYKLLQKEKYTGIYIINGKVFDNVYPQIINPCLFERAKTRRAFNQNGSYSKVRTYLLRGKAHCGYCGNKFLTQSGRGTKNMLVKYYKCAGRMNHLINCVNKSVKKEILEEVVLDAFNMIFTNSKALRTLKDYASKNSDLTFKQEDIQNFYDSAKEYDDFFKFNYYVENIVVFNDKIDIYFVSPAKSLHNGKYNLFMQTENTQHNFHINFYV